VALGALGVEHAAQALGGGALVASRPALFVLTAALVSLAYVALFVACELLANGWGRSSLLVMDWMLGSGLGALALPWPRAHARTLLGGAPVAQLGAAGSALALVLLAIAASALYARRVPP
jgi:hypothetical protein